jgi:hypothetical protein
MLQALKVKFIRWLLASDDVKAALVDVFVQDTDVQEWLDKRAEEVANDVVEEAERNRRGGVHADDVQGLSDAINDQFGSEAFERAVTDAIDGLKVEADDVEGLDEYVQESIATGTIRLPSVRP